MRTKLVGIAMVAACAGDTLFEVVRDGSSWTAGAGMLLIRPGLALAEAAESTDDGVEHGVEHMRAAASAELQSPGEVDGARLRAQYRTVTSVGDDGSRQITRTFVDWFDSVLGVPCLVNSPSTSLLPADFRGRCLPRLAEVALNATGTGVYSDSRCTKMLVRADKPYSLACEGSRCAVLTLGAKFPTRSVFTASGGSRGDDGKWVPSDCRPTTLNVDAHEFGPRLSADAFVKFTTTSVVEQIPCLAAPREATLAAW